MADATPALETLEAELRSMKARMAVTDPRKQAVNRLLLKVASTFGGTATAAEIKAVERATAIAAAWPDEGDFSEVIDRAEAAVGAVGDP
jgi:hypothetical protein